MTPQEMVQDLFRVRQLLGRVPSRVEYAKHGKVPGQEIVKVFGSYALFIKNAGLDYLGKKQDKQEIRRQAHEKLVLEVEKRKIVTPPKIVHRLLCISDMHNPYGHPDTISFLAALHKKYQFDHCLIGGDEIDYHAMSFHEHDPDLPNAGHELELAIKGLKPLYELFPRADVLESNHGSLVYRKGKHHGFPRHVLKDYNQILGAPASWSWRESFTYQFPTGQKALAHHGYSQNTLQASQQRGMCLIQFHFHNKLSIDYWKREDELLWALQSGCLIDDASYAFAYNKISVKRPIEGCAAVIDGFPVLFPMVLDANGRWNKRVP